MKKIFLIAVLLIVFSVAVFAQQTCPDLTPQITDCQKQGLDPKYDVPTNDKCKQVIGCCSNDYVKQDQDCRAKGGGSVLGVDSNSCTFLRECKMPTICTPLAEQRAACIATGRTVVEGTDWTNGCEQVKCRTCKTEEEINKEKESCENSKGNFQKWQESDGCYSTSCTQSNPNMCDWVEKEKDRCKSNGGSPREVKNNYGGPSNCPMIVCDYPAGAEYSSKDKCESSTNCFCEYRDCNYVMQGTSYEDTCGKNFVPGWYCQIPKPSDGVIKCGGNLGGYCPRGYRCDSNDWNKEGKCIKDENQQTSCYVRSEEDINREKQRCDQIGGKLEKREDHWSGAENCYSYRCISQDGKCGSSSMGMLDCPEGNYCEQPNYQGNYGSNYKQEYGKCVLLNKQEICPLLDAKEKNKCFSMGGSAEVKKNDKGCEYYECKQNKEFCGGIAGIQCPQGYKCELDGNYPDAGGKCVPEQKVCMKDEEVKAQVNKCVSNNGSPKISSEKGCVKEITCLTEQEKKIPQKDIPPEEKKEQDITKLFNVAFKLEELRIQFDKLKKKTQNIANYYEQEGELKYADKFKKVSYLFDDALNRVDGIKADLRNSIDKDQTNEESMGNVKKSIQDLKNNMKEILKELLR